MMMRVRPAIGCISEGFSKRSFGILSPLFGGADLQNDVRQEFPGTPDTNPRAMAKGNVQVSDVNGVTVVTEDTRSLGVTVAAVVGAGTRHEGSRDSGVARMLKNMAFKKSANRSPLRFDRDFIDIGANVTSSLEREQYILKVTALPQFAESAAALLGDTLSNPVFETWEITEFKKYAQNEINFSDQNDQLVDAIHAAAFYDTETLGRPLYGPLSVSATNVANFQARNVFANTVTVIGTGIEHADLVDSVTSSFALESGMQEKPAASYVGGEARVHGARTTDIAIAFPVAASDYLAAQVASAILGSGSLTRSNLKCGHGTAGRLNKNVVLADGAVHAASAFCSTYSDAGLLGIRAHVLGPGNSDIVATIADQFKALADGVTDEEVARAKNSIKGGLLACQDSQAGLQDFLSKAALSGNISANTIAEAFDSVDAVTTAQVQAAVANAIKQNPSVASVGDIADVPRYDAVASLF